MHLTYRLLVEGRPVDGLSPPDYNRVIAVGHPCGPAIPPPTLPENLP
jgi:hypothetical protein